MDNIINEELEKTVKNIFNKLFNLEIKHNDNYEVVKQEHDWDISGVVGIVGDYEGIIAIRLKEEMAEKLLEKSRVDAPDISARWNLINDMVGEIVNNISGNVISQVAKYKFRQSVPITVQGKNHILNWPVNAPVYAIPFTLEYGTIEVQYSLS
ncbi:MAG: chemotaxis protein CheX [Candidatus Scalindua sp.]|nr:chemotaxis protein CheX [Candidatus Scalindua sp.]